MGNGHLWYLRFTIKVGSPLVFELRNKVFSNINIRRQEEVITVYLAVRVVYSLLLPSSFLRT